MSTHGISAKEIMDELSVKFSGDFVERFSSAFERKKYDNLEHLIESLAQRLPIEGDKYQIGQELFELGVIGNISNDGRRFFSSYRQEEELKPGMRIQVHRGLWNYFNVRGNSK